VNVHGSGDCFCFSVECVGSGNLFWVLMNDLLWFFFFFGYLFGSVCCFEREEGKTYN
jgi:hypothetical protein